MYAEHFNLKLLPFENVPDPAFFFDQDDYARARKRSTDSLKAGRGLIVVTGPIGSGKTTLSQMIKTDFAADTSIIWLAEPPGDSADLFLFIAQELGLQPSTSARTFVIRDIRNALLRMNAEGRRCLVIIDEAHLMSDDVINGIRLLNNLEEGSTKLIQILLLGQNELMENISRPEMAPFKQRIATLENLGKMNAGRIREYIAHRIQVAGGYNSILADSAWEALVLPFRSGGTPRIINSLCDRSLNVAFERGKAIVDAYDVLEAAQLMGLGKEIFHYTIELEHRKRAEEVSLVEEKDSAKEPETQSQVPGPIFNREPVDDDKVLGSVQSERFQPARNSHENFISFANNEESLKKPLFLLLLSVSAFILSVFFYCQISGTDPKDCLYKLFF
jgi:MSHA biogenesis protein MshM